MSPLNDQQNNHLVHAEGCECEDCHGRDPLNGPRSLFVAALALIIGLAALGLIWIRLFG